MKLSSVGGNFQGLTFLFPNTLFTRILLSDTHPLHTYNKPTKETQASHAVNYSGCYLPMSANPCNSAE